MPENIYLAWREKLPLFLGSIVSIPETVTPLPIQVRIQVHPRTCNILTRNFSAHDAYLLFSGIVLFWSTRTFGFGGFRAVWIVPSTFSILASVREGKYTHAHARILVWSHDAVCAWNQGSHLSEKSEKELR